MGDGEGNAAAAGTDICYCGGIQPLGSSDGEIDEEFAFGARHEHPGIDIKVDAIELTRVGQIGDGLTGEAALTQVSEG